jgi:hypothetical protein
MADAHGRLVEEARGVVSEIDSFGPIAVVRDERASPLVDILREPKGFAKLPYTRHAAPYGLIDSDSLFEWVIAREGTRVIQVYDWEESCQEIHGKVLIHVDGGFRVQGKVQDLAGEAERWRHARRRLQVIRVVGD